MSSTLERLPRAECSRPASHGSAARSVTQRQGILEHPRPEKKRCIMPGFARPGSGRPDPASLWVVDTRTLGRRPGNTRLVRLAAPVTEPMGIEVIAIPAGSEIDVEVRLEAVAEGVLVSGTAAGTAVGQCSRCLVDVTEPVVARIQELFAYPDSTTAATTEDDEVPRLVGDLIDMEPLVRDEIVLSLPLVPLCRPDCRGLCPGCGERLDDLEPDHSHEMMDPRWAALRDKFAEDSSRADEHQQRPARNTTRAGSGD
jgi:uncharacterized protein